MLYKMDYDSPVGKITIVSDEISVMGLFIEGQKYYLGKLKEPMIDNDVPVLKKAKEWLESYFQGKDPTINFPLNPQGTPFQKEVWSILSAIPYGKTCTYKEIAQQIAQKRNKTSMSSQAVGQAVGHNPISIIIPCHRVIGSNKSLTGYAGGLDKKEMLLNIEKVKIKEGYVEQ